MHAFCPLWQLMVMKIQSAVGGKASLTLLDGTVMTVSTRELLPANTEFINCVDNLVALGYLNESSVLCNLQYRYHRDVIYTMTGPVQLAINPFKDVSVSGSDVIMAYREKILDSPHVYVRADAAYSDMIRGERTFGVLTKIDLMDKGTDFIIARLALLGPEEKSIVTATENKTPDQSLKLKEAVTECKYAINHKAVVAVALRGSDHRRATNKESVEIKSFKSSTQNSTVNEFIIINIPKEDVEPKQIILDLDDQPMWESAKTVAPTPNSAIIQLDVDENFVINSTHLNMILENKFDGYLRADPHDHIREFLAICNMFRYGKTQNEAVKLLIFPFSLCDEAKTWFNELNEESITSWEQIGKAFINKFFPPLLFNRLLLEIRNFSQLAILDVNAGGIFLYKSPNQAFQLLEDKVLFNHDWPIKSKNEHHRKSVFFADGSDRNNDNSRFMEKLKTVDSQIISLNEELQDMREKYNELRKRNTSKNNLNDDTPMCERHEVNSIQSEDYQNQNSHDSSSRQSLHDPNDSEK
ncbi:reverse transcriptase domain-containing protein [Tanacetum coccineum]|uniref:Reverse transcriptase domain-containing protein n=1 Tax=Tanacetum coccineum TaxID=301880 RepID=A0ABQ5A1T2_9ASTR